MVIVPGGPYVKLVLLGYQYIMIIYIFSLVYVYDVETFKCFKAWLKKLWQRGYSPFTIQHTTIACVHPVTFVNYMWGQNLKGFMA